MWLPNIEQRLLLWGAVDIALTSAAVTHGELEGSGIECLDKGPFTAMREDKAEQDMDRLGGGAVSPGSRQAMHKASVWFLDQVEYIFRMMMACVHMGALIS